MDWMTNKWTITLTPHEPKKGVSLTITTVTILVLALLAVSFGNLFIYYGLINTDKGNNSQIAKLKEKIDQLRTQNRHQNLVLRQKRNLKQLFKKTQSLQKTILKSNGLFGVINKKNKILAKYNRQLSATNQKLILSKAIEQQTATNKKLQQLDNYLKQQRKVLKNMPTMWPTKGWRSSPFGYRNDPMGGENSDFHSGLDLAAWPGTSVRATAGGTVSHAGYDGPYGKKIVIKHDYGYKTVYGHLSKIRVDAGDSVSAGSIIGVVGSTGRSTGTHLHYEVLVNDQAVDPDSYLVYRYQDYK